MPLPITVKLTPRSFDQVPEWGKIDWISADPCGDLKAIPPKSRKELGAFLDFAKSGAFTEVVTRIAGSAPPSDQLEIDLHLDGEDPPDLTLKKPILRIEVTDYPPNTALLNRILLEKERPGYIPFYAETGCDPEAIERFLEMPESHIEPRFFPAIKECEALTDYLKMRLVKKDNPANEVLLLHGASFSSPEGDAIELALRATKIKHLKCIVLVRQSGSIPYYIS